MSLTNTNIQLKRSTHNLDELKNFTLNFGEPFFIDKTDIDNTNVETKGMLSDPCNAYLVIGRKQKDDETDAVTVEKSPIFKAFSRNRVEKFVFYDENEEDGKFITNESGAQLAVNRITAYPITKENLSSENSTKYYILCQTDSEDEKEKDKVYKFTLDDLGIFVNGRGIMQGAAWNDYAELREISGDALPGQVVCDQGDGTVALSNKLYQPCAHVVSDTFGHLIGEKKEGMVPIAVAGRVLVALDSSIAEGVEVGDCVCAGLNGLAHKMTRQEIINYPDRIIGTVCEIPKDNFIGSIEVDGRIWINVK